MQFYTCFWTLTDWSESVSIGTPIVLYSGFGIHKSILGNKTIILLFRVNIQDFVIRRQLYQLKIVLRMQVL